MLSVLGAMLFLLLRAAFDSPAIPALDKELIPNVGILIGVVFFHAVRGRALLPRGNWPNSVHRTWK